jgi:tRNA-specific 2-thiouridylase
MRERVVVAMSGGVDSSVAAALLVEQGYEVVGITMCFGSASGGNFADTSRRKPPCCSPQAIEDARRVAHKLGIKHYVLNMQKALQERVIKDFCSEYLRGRTPNPCVRCNQFIKFGELLKKALALDAKFIATGHYARISRAYNLKLKTYSYFLKKAKDQLKDQSYFLYRLNQSQLKHVLFPLGDYTKSEVRELARKFHLSVADKAASQEICFLPDDDYRKFLQSYAGKEFKPGPIVNNEGKVLGRHKGIAYYTIGQREGLGIAWKHPLYIAKINARNNTITVGAKDEVLRKEFLVKDEHFAVSRPKKKVAALVKIRYNHREAKAVLSPAKNKIKVRFSQPQFAITPGQSAVFYDKDKVLGGGIIDKVLDA